MKFIIEHLEPELFEWCRIEYEHISEIVGKQNLIFTNVKNSKNKKFLENLGLVYSDSICEKDFGKMCVLSQFAKKTLVSSDKNNFDCFLFGGILGDNPPKKRTEHISRCRLIMQSTSQRKS
jgi:ribosome biogenesis SPOUT family RNA methylase Rps3